MASGITDGLLLAGLVIAFATAAIIRMRQGRTCMWHDPRDPLSE